MFKFKYFPNNILRLIFSLFYIPFTSIAMDEQKISEVNKLTIEEPFPLEKLPPQLLPLIAKYVIKQSIVETDDEFTKRAKELAELTPIKIELTECNDVFSLDPKNFSIKIPKSMVANKNATCEKLGAAALSFDNNKLCFSANYRYYYGNGTKFTKLFVVNLKSKKHASCIVPSLISRYCISAQGDCIFNCKGSNTNVYLFNPITQNYKAIAHNNHGVHTLALNKQSTKLIAMCGCEVNKISEMTATKKPVTVTKLNEYFKLIGVSQIFPQNQKTE